MLCNSTKLSKIERKKILIKIYNLIFFFLLKIIKFYINIKIETNKNICCLAGMAICFVDKNHTSTGIMQIGQTGTKYEDMMQY